jgi:hyperosmotically inducible protein
MTVAAMLLTSPAVARAQDADRDHPAAKAQDTADKSGNKVEDAWILTKVKSKFIGEDALKDSNINVDVQHGVVVLKGTVASEAGRARAVAIAKDTDGVVRVDDRLAIGLAKGRETDADRTTAAKADDAADDTKHAAKDAADDTKHAAKDAKERTKHAADKSADATKDTVGTAGEAVTDGWITTKVKSSFVGVDALDGSDINVDTNDHVVTLTGTVPSAVARAEAVRLAKQVKGVTKVSDKLTIAPKK